MQGRLTLHVRILVHISQVSGVFLKGQCQCSCTDALTKLLIPYRYRNCFRRCLCYISLCGFNNNQFINNLKAPTVQVGAFADIYSAGSAAGRCYSIRPLSFKSSSTSVPLTFFITTLSSIFSLNESFISVIGFLSIA